jgi:sugar phosphate isomerase/epimerase
MINPQLAVSTWSLHRKLGVSYKDAEGGTGRVATPAWGPGECALLDIPAQAAAHGIGKVEICHFHFPSTDLAYLADLRSALDEAGVTFLTLLIDEGDITNPDPAVRARDLETMKRWIGVASACGAQRARVIAGRSAPDPEGEAMRISAAGLRELVVRAADGGLRLATENWFGLLDRPEEVIQLLEMLDGQLGLCFDFGNWRGDRKYDDLPRIAPYAETTHAKAHYTDAGVMDREDYVRCLEICRAAEFFGPHSLIFDGPGDEWAELDKIQEAVTPYLQ